MIDRTAQRSRPGSRETAGDPFDLRRFVDAQSSAYDQAPAELRQGCKRTHWIWFVLPQLRGLGRSQFAQLYGLTGRQGAVAIAPTRCSGRGCEPAWKRCARTLALLRELQADG